MKSYFALIALMFISFLAIFFIVDLLAIPFLNDPSPWMGSGGPVAAAIGVALLISDVILPVPSTLVMVANGAAFGIAVGSMLSLLGCLVAGLFGFGIGRSSSSIIDRLISEREQLYFDSLINKWGIVAVIVSRPIPIVSETVAIVAGTSSLSWPSMAIGTVAGSLPAAVIYAIAGSAAADAVSSTIVFAVVLGIAGLTSMVVYARHRLQARNASV